MHILYFHQHFSTPRGRGGIRSYEMAQGLIRAGHDVTIVCGSRSGGVTGLTSDFVRGRREGNTDGINIIEFNLAYSNSDSLLKRTSTFLKFAFKSVHIALSYKYDLLFATTTPLTAGIPGIFARWLRGKPFVFEVRDLWPELPKEMGVIKNPAILAAMSALEWCSYHSAHRCIGLSPGIVEGIKKRGVDASKVELVPNGCDLDIFSEVSAAERPKEIPSNNLMAIFAGTHGLANGLDSVLNAAYELKKRGRLDITIVFVGDGKLKPTLQKRAQDENLNNVVFLEPVNKDKVAELLQNSDVGLQVLSNIPAFYYGTSPNKFFDYISAGLPVINNYPGWLADMINDNNCGYAIPPDDASAFADALESAADNNEKLTLMGRNSKALAIKSFDRIDLATKWVAWVTGGGK